MPETQSNIYRPKYSIFLAKAGLKSLAKQLTYIKKLTGETRQKKKLTESLVANFSKGL